MSVGPGRFEAWVTAKPMEGRANEAIVNLLVRNLHLSPRQLRLVKGWHGRHKVFTIVE